MPSREDILKFRKHFERAQGWLALDKVEEAGKALDELPHDFQIAPEVLGLRTAIALAAGRWESAATIARQLTSIEPNVPIHWTHWAYATRRHQDLAAARRILDQALDRFPNDALIQFNLACYAAQQSQFPEALALLTKAILNQPELKDVAKDDPDLIPLWEVLGRKSLE